MEHIDLSSGASYFRSPDAATGAAIASLKQGQTKYGPTEGIPALRTSIAERYQETIIPVTSEQVLVTLGSKQALHNLFSVLLREQDEIVIPTPAWFGFHGLLKHSQGSLVTLPTFASDNYSISPEALDNILSTRTRILLLTNPGNPTGRLYSKEELEAILEVTAKYPELYLISDEIYDFNTYGRPFTSILSCKGAAPERTFIVNGFSKTFAMSGWRVGYIIGPSEQMKQCIEYQGNTLSGVSIFIQEAALATMKNKDEALQPMLSVLAKHRTIMQQGLDAIPNVRYFLPEGAYYFFPDFNYYLGSTTAGGDTINSSIELCSYLQEHYQLLLSPGEYFGAPGYARMSFAVEEPCLRKGLSRLKAALSTLHRT